MGRLVIISNRLSSTVVLGKDHSVRLTSGQGGIASGLRSIYKKKDNLWVGWAGVFTKLEKEREEIRQQLQAEQQHPVFLTDHEIEAFYHGFCNETLWPNFHYFNQYTQYRKTHWQTYCKVNKKYADEVLRIARPGDTFWVHDYQLLLLPALLREALPNATIGFFLHTPFPDLSSYRRLPWREALLRGMLGADLLGFHTYDDVRHFLFGTYNLLGIPHLNDTLFIGQRKVRIECIPMGIDYGRYSSIAKSPEVALKRERIASSFPEKQVAILSIDRLDYTKGIPQRLRAFNALLMRYPRYRGRVSMILIVVPSREEVHYYQYLKQEIDLLVGQINGKYSSMGWQPIRYFYQAFSLEWLSAFYTYCDLALVTPLIDGMNLVCKEFVASRQNTGVLILSENAGSSKELYEALRVNPHDEEDLIEKLKEALRMTKKEQKRRLHQMQQTLSLHDINHWLSSFMEHLHEVKTEQEALQTLPFTDKEYTDIVASFKAATRRLILLDYDGTLVPFNSQPELTVPDAVLLEILKQLSSAPENEVVIISGRDRSDLQKWLGELPLHLAAEHGAWLKKKKGQWETITTLDTSWKEDIREILTDFVHRTPGSFIEEKTYSLAWHYRRVDPSFGQLRAWSLVSNLRYILSRMNLSVLEGNRVIEIKNPEVNKGHATKIYLDALKPNFVLAFGDDQTDEDTFAVLDKNSYTIKVGGGASAARYSVTDEKSVRKILLALAKNTNS